MPTSPSPTLTTPIQLLIFGGGYLGEAAGREAIARGGRATATSRRPERRAELEAAGITAIAPDDDDALSQAVATATHILITAAPEASGCPGLARLVPALSRSGAYPDWIGYISSSAVYGDRAGGWAFEDEPLNAASLIGARRVRAEHDWLDAGRGMGLTVQIFRLPALYGPGRSPVDRILGGTARRIVKPGQVFNRIHVDDAVTGLFASMAKPYPGRAYTLCDDEPASSEAVLDWTTDQLGLPRLPEVSLDDANISDGMRRFYNDSKRLSNARAKSELGWRPRYPSWREGLAPLIP
jgi:nucleoside-diphosphate-sugar epimerase